MSVLKKKGEGGKCVSFFDIVNAQRYFRALRRSPYKCRKNRYPTPNNRFNFMSLHLALVNVLNLVCACFVRNRWYGFYPHLFGLDHCDHLLCNDGSSLCFDRLIAFNEKIGFVNIIVSHAFNLIHDVSMVIEIKEFVVSKWKMLLVLNS